MKKMNNRAFSYIIVIEFNWFFAGYRLCPDQRGLCLGHSTDKTSPDSRAGDVFVSGQGVQSVCCSELQAGRPAEADETQ